MSALFNGNPSATIISCNSPTNASEEMDIITFYNELYSLVRYIPKHNVLIIGRDMNAQIGKEQKRKFCLDNPVKQKLVISNSLFAWKQTYTL